MLYQFASPDFPHFVARHVLYDFVGLRAFVSAQLGVEEFFETIRRKLAFRAFDLENRMHPKTPLLVGNAYNHSVGDTGIVENGVLHLGGVHVLPAGHDHVRTTVGDVQEAFLVEPTEVADAEEPVFLGFDGLRPHVLCVQPHSRLAEYLAYFAAGKRPTLLVAYLQLATEGASHAAAVLQPFFASYERACDHLGLAVHLVHFSRADALDPGKLYFVGAGAAAVEHGLQAFQVSGLEGRMAHHPVHHRGSQAYELNPMLFDELERLSFVEAFHEVHGLPEEQSDVRGIAVQVVKQGTGDKLFRPRGLPRHRRPSRQIHLAVGRPDFLHDELGFSRRPSRRDSPRGLAGEERQDLGSMGELSSDPVPHVLLRYAILVVAIPCRYQQLALEQRVYMVAFFIGSLGGHEYATRSQLELKFIQ